MSFLQKAVPISLAVILGLANGVYVFQPYLVKEAEARHQHSQSNSGSTTPSLSSTSDTPQSPDRKK